MEYTNVIRRKLISLVEYSKELSPFKDYSFDQYVGNYFIKRTGERLIQLIVENMVDINAVVISQKNLPPPKDCMCQVLVGNFFLTKSSITFLTTYPNLITMIFSRKLPRCD